MGHRHLHRRKTLIIFTVFNSNGDKMRNLANKRIMVTGGDGFLGRYVIAE